MRKGQENLFRRLEKKKKKKEKSEHPDDRMKKENTGWGRLNVLLEGRKRTSPTCTCIRVFSLSQLIEDMRMSQCHMTSTGLLDVP